MTIVIGCDSFLALRNVRNGDLGQHLSGVRVLVDPHQLAGSVVAQPAGVEIAALVDFAADNDAALSRLTRRTYFARKAYYDGRTLWQAMLRSSHHRHRGSAVRRAISVTASGYQFAWAWLRGAAGQAQQGRRQVALALQRHPLADHYYRLFDQLQPALVAGFSPEGLREMLLLEAANAAGIPTVVMIRSRDNLSAKIRHLPYADQYLVWSEATRQFFRRIYPEIDPDRISVTGSPQFDRHMSAAHRLPRAEFFERMRLQPDRPLVVYTMATPGLIDHEIDIAQQLAEAAHAGRLARGAQLLVRGHPRMFGSNVRLLQQEYPEARAYPPPTQAVYRSGEHEAKVVRLILEDEPVHLATVAYQDVQVNVCGTMTIDSAILDRPTVNVYYDAPADVPAGLSVRRFYERSDVRQMMAYGASRLAHDPDECVQFINYYLNNPAADAEGRQRAREQECGPLDGQAGQRIAQTIQEVAARPKNGALAAATRTKRQTGLMESPLEGNRP